MDETSKRIDKDAVAGQGIAPNSEHDAGAIPSPHSLPVSNEFNAVDEQQGDAPETAGLKDSVSGQPDGTVSEVGDTTDDRSRAEA